MVTNPQLLRLTFVSAISRGELEQNKIFLDSPNFSIKVVSRMATIMFAPRELIASSRVLFVVVRGIVARDGRVLVGGRWVGG